MIIKDRARRARLAKVRQADAEHKAMMAAAAKVAGVKLSYVRLGGMKTRDRKIAAMFEAKTAAKSLDP